MKLNIQPWILFVLIVVVLASFWLLPDYMKYKKKRKGGRQPGGMLDGLMVGNGSSGNGGSGDGDSGDVLSDVLDNPSMLPPNSDLLLNYSCIAGSCPVSTENILLQQALNRQLARVSDVMMGVKSPITDYENQVYGRYNQLRTTGNTPVIRVRVDGFVWPLEINGQFDRKTEQMLWLLSGKTSTTLNEIYLYFSGNSDGVKTLFSLGKM